MKEKTRQLLSNKLIMGSLVMIIGNNLSNVGNYLYHLAMGRLLGPSSYGELSAVISLLTLILIIPSSFGLVVVKLTSSTHNEEETKSLITWFKSIAIRSGLILGALFLLLSPFIAWFIHLSLKEMFLVAPIFTLSFVTFFNRSILQGLVKFGKVVSTFIIEVFTKLGLSILFVFLGFSVMGALGGIVMGSMVAFIISNWYLRSYQGSKALAPNFRNTIKYAINVLVQSLALASLYTADVILVKHFFDSYTAGLYASLSTVGKIIIFGTSPVATVMFPLVAKKKSLNENYKNIFMYSLFLTSLGSLLVLVLYYGFPELIIRTLFGVLYIQGASLLGWMGIVMSLYSLCSLILSYHLSLGHRTPTIFAFSAAVSQIIGIILFHNSIPQILTVTTTILFVLLGCLFVYSKYVKSE